MYEEDKESIESDMAPFGFITSSNDDEEIIVDRKDGLVWTNHESFDEYGTPWVTAIWW